jgi:hypothetical protein
MTLAAAFGITEADIETVLQQNATQVANTDGQSFETMAEKIYDDWTDIEHTRIADAALDGGIEMDDQTNAAHAEIRTILVEQGVLKR